MLVREERITFMLSLDLIHAAVGISTTAALFSLNLKPFLARHVI